MSELSSKPPKHEIIRTIFGSCKTSNTDAPTMRLVLVLSTSCEIFTTTNFPLMVNYLFAFEIILSFR